MNLDMIDMVKNDQSKKSGYIEIITNYFSKLKEIPFQKINETFISGEAFNLKLSLKLYYSELKNLDEIDDYLFIPYDFNQKERDQIKRLMGAKIYSAHLNYFYGIVVENAIREILRLEIEKKRGYHGYDNYSEINDKVFSLIYGKKNKDLWAEFCDYERLGAKSYYVPSKIYSLEYDSFTYWLSKKRIKLCAPELNASLISRGLNYLERIGIKNELY
tara:strand:- start:26 stop:676 length:651 start_codon:yes stop_codon:yes gene_type:complete